MATEKALFTSQADFTTPGISPFQVNPFLSYTEDTWDGETPPFPPTNGGTQEKVVLSGGLKGTVQNAPLNKGTSLNGAYLRWRNWGVPASPKHVLSVWIKPTLTDVSKQYAIIFTNRGDRTPGTTTAQPNRGIHLTLYNGFIEARTHNKSTGAMEYIGTDGSDPTYMKYYKAKANVWQHVVVYYDYNDPTGRIEIYVDGVLYAYSSSRVHDINGVHSNSITVGELTSNGDTATGNNFGGEIDDLRYFVGNTWTRQQIVEYYNYVKNANYLDHFSEPGALKLGKFTNLYTLNPKTWTSPVVDLVQPFDDFGRVQVNFEQPQGTNIRIETRTSTDQSTWSDWNETDVDGKVLSPKRRYFQVRAILSTSNQSITPKLMEIQILDYERKKRLTLTSEPLVAYYDKVNGLERFGELANAYDIYITEEVKGEETIEWLMASDDKTRKRMGREPVEMNVIIGDKQFIIREVNDKKDASGRKLTRFTGEATWYELGDAKIPGFEAVEKTAQEMADLILGSTIVATQWKVIASDVTIKRTIRQSNWTNALELLRELENTYGCELDFDTVNKTIRIVQAVGENNGIRFYADKNIKEIERNMDTYGLITRLYAKGKNDMTFASVNTQFPGKAYVENTKWVDAMGLRNRIRPDEWIDGRYTVPQNLYEDSVSRLEVESKPNISYVMQVQILSMLSGHEHESVGLGDVVYAVEPDILYMTLESRIVRRKYNVRQPWKTEIELNQPKKELADASKRAIDDLTEIFDETDPVDTSDIQQMTVFNHLLNSRAEDGTNYWTTSGTDISIEPQGFSGGSSWAFAGDYGRTNTLMQSVYGVSHRSAYTVSAYVATEGEITRGPSQDAFIGVKIRIHYTEPDSQGRTYEEHLLAIPDLTQEEQE